MLRTPCHETAYYRLKNQDKLVILAAWMHEPVADTMNAALTNLRRCDALSDSEKD